MAEWYVKDLSKLTGASVQTLHHYDRISLLTPSIRLSNGYRVYSEKDLLRLQQIIALKFFEFSLSQIKILLSGEASAIEHLTVQCSLLEKKAMALLDASNSLKKIISEGVTDKSIPWETLIKLIEVYRMTQQLDHSWVKEIFTPDELKQYAEFEAELKANSTPEQKATFEKNRENLVNEMKHHLNEDPSSAIGIEIGKKCLDWINGVYGKKYAHLRTKKLEKGFAEGKGLKEVGLTPEIVSWMDRAIDAYLRNRIYGILNQVGTGISKESIAKDWKKVLDDMYGDDDSRKTEIYDVVLVDNHVSDAAKEWLKTVRKKIG